MTDNEKLDFCLQNVSSDEITKLLNDGFSIDDICEAVKNVSQRTVESFNFFTISNLTDEEKMCQNIIEKTYLNASSAGDKNVYFIDGRDLFMHCGGSDCTVDRTHPSDLGFFSMAKCVADVINDNGLL